MAGYQDLFSDPMAAIGYGLLTSRTNPIGEGAKLLQASDAAKQEREYKDAILRLKAEKNALPKLQFNPVTGEMFDMRTGTPYTPDGTASAGGMGDPPIGYGLPQPAPTSGIGAPPPGLSPKGKAIWEANQINKVDKLEEEKRKEQNKIEEEGRKPPTEAQSLSANYATRMGETEKILTPLEMKGISTANQGERALESLPFGNYMTSDDYKLYKQAQEDWVRAKLRKESGAVIADEEMEREITTYFPQPGDTPAVIEQKRKSRETALSGVEGGAKPGFKAPRYKAEDTPATEPSMSEIEAEMKRRGLLQ